MGLIGYLNQRLRNMDVFDVKLAQLAAMFLTLFIVKLVPEIMTISIWWFVGLVILSTIKPFYAFWLK